MAKRTGHSTTERVGQGASNGRTVYRSAKSGRYVVTKTEARAAARTKVTVDQKLGKDTPGWVKDLAEGA